MQLGERLEAAWKAGTARERASNQPRNLTESDMDGWADALDAREKAIKPQTIEDVRALVRNVNPVMWWQLQTRYKWLQKQMKKLGLNPEDARYIL